jgi:hypothetical protein
LPIELETVMFNVPVASHADCGTSTVKEVAVGVVVGVSVEPKPLTTVSDVKFVPVIVTGIDHVLLTIAIGGERREMVGAFPDVVTGMTVMLAVAELHTFPSQAVKVAEPDVTPVTTPLELTVATAGALEVNVNVTPEIAVPEELYAFTTSCVVDPIWRLLTEVARTTDVTVFDVLLPPEGVDGVWRLHPAITNINSTTENSFVFIVTFWGRGY